MATIAIVSVGITGRLNASFEMARRLGEWGCTVVIASLDGRASERVRAEGLTFFALDAGVPDDLRATGKKQKSQRQTGFWDRRSLRVKIARARGEAAVGGNGLDALVETHKPDLLLIESELHDAIIFSQSLSVPVALLEYHVSTLRMPGVPPLSSTLTPAAPLFRMRAAAAWQWELVKRRARQLYRRWYHKGWDERSVWQRVAEENGVNLQALATTSQWPLLQYPDLPCIHLCAAEFDFPHAVEDTRDCVGPMVQKVRSSDDDDAIRCRALLEELASGNKPLVVCATGSILSLPPFLRKVVRASGEQPWNLIVATGRGSDPSVLGDLPDNVHAFRFIPQLDVLQHASLFICHGGISSIHESLLAGVPMLLYSGGCMDEDGNAARVAWHGFGRRGDMARDDWQAIRNNITSLLSDAHVRLRVAGMQDTLKRYEQDERLRDAIRNSAARDDLLQ
ncbi:MAG: nucleotide disphospho-sugar-binding domain-containing protein [Pseudomonadota bacterium]